MNKPKPIEAATRGGSCAPAPGSAFTAFLIQEKRGGEWVDYAIKDTAEIVMARLSELNTEKPGRVFRGIIRVISDHLLPNAADHRPE